MLIFQQVKNIAALPKAEKKYHRALLFFVFVGAPDPFFARSPASPDMLQATTF